MHVRFDDARPGHEQHLVFGEPSEVLQAHATSDVPGVITAAEAHARRGRWVAGFVAYEAAGGFDDALVTHDGTDGLPLAWFGVFDEPRRDGAWPEPGPFAFGDWTPDLPGADQAAAVADIRGAIEAGDTYQVNLTFRLNAPFEGDPMAAYRSIVENQRGAFGAYLDIGRQVVLSASPELFFGWDGDALTVRPMKGTMRRGRWSGEDEAIRLGLIGSEKNRAENLMIVDLLRNDLGRIAEFGSVTVPTLFEAERYATLWQLTSTVTAKPRPDTSLLDVFTALFPSGSVTGAPKVRTMQIIRRLERTPRGVYCGAVGMLEPVAPGGFRATFNVAIRTVVLDQSAGRAAYGTGGAITWDSTPEDEYRESMLKAAVLTTRRPDFGLFETMRWEPGTGVVRQERHLRRIAASAAYFGFPIDGAAARSMLATVTGAAPLRLKLTLDPGGRLSIESSPAPPDSDVRLAVDDVPVDAGDPLLFHKTTRRDLYEAAAQRHLDAGDVVLVNGAGRITETTIGNVAVCLDGGWVTPPLADGCLPGVYREELLARGVLTERPINVDLLPGAEGIAVISSLRGWRTAYLEERLSPPHRTGTPPHRG